MQQTVLHDKDVFPSEEVIFSHIGARKKLWCSLFDFIHAEHPEISVEWRYYLDGKSWLMKVTKKSRTIFWLSLTGNTFRLTFYFNQRAETALEESGLSEELKNIFFTSKYINKIRPITITVSGKQDIEQIKILTAIKLRVK
ncbi:MAG: DUF3788 family protein [Bacteroidota bacterium]